MKDITYITLDKVNPQQLTSLLNKQTIRKHLIEHAPFDTTSTKEWIKTKMLVNASQGCKVRAIEANKALAGWCGIQFENGQYEMAIVISNKHWGLGPTIFLDMMSWAKKLGHKTITIHFLHTRPEYTFLRKRANKMYDSVWAGNKFTSYELRVE